MNTEENTDGPSDYNHEYDSLDADVLGAGEIFDFTYEACCGTVRALQMRGYAC